MRQQTGVSGDLPPIHTITPFFEDVESRLRAHLDSARSVMIRSFEEGTDYEYAVAEATYNSIHDVLARWNER